MTITWPAPFFIACGGKYIFENKLLGIFGGDLHDSYRVKTVDRSLLSYCFKSAAKRSAVAFSGKSLGIFSTRSSTSRASLALPEAARAEAKW